MAAALTAPCVHLDPSKRFINLPINPRAWQDWHSWSYHYERPKQWIQEDENLCYIGGDVDVTLGESLFEHFEPTLQVKRLPSVVEDHRRPSS